MIWENSNHLGNSNFIWKYVRLMVLSVTILCVMFIKKVCICVNRISLLGCLTIIFLNFWKDTNSISENNLFVQLILLFELIDLQPSCSLHLNLLYGAVYRVSPSERLLSSESAPGLVIGLGEELHNHFHVDIWLKKKHKQ